MFYVSLLIDECFIHSYPRYRIFCVLDVCNFTNKHQCLYIYIYHILYIRCCYTWCICLSMFRDIFVYISEIVGLETGRRGTRWHHGGWPAMQVRQRRWPPTMAMNEIRDPILPWKLTCPLKIDGWKMYSLLKWSLFSGFQGCKWPKIKCPRHPVIFSDDDWDVQSPPQHGMKLIFRFQ